MLLAVKHQPREKVRYRTIWQNCAETWWLDNNMPHSPERMDEMFQQLVMTGVRAAVGIAM